MTQLLNNMNCRATIHQIRSCENHQFLFGSGLSGLGVINATFDPEKKLPAGITEIAIKPNRRRQGLAKAILISLLSEHHQQGIGSHVAYIKQTNKASRQLFEGLGFKVTSEANRHGFVEYRYDEVV